MAELSLSVRDTRHRYEMNNDYRDKLKNAGLTIAGTSPDGRLVEIVEVVISLVCGGSIPSEFKSRPNRPHPLFKQFIYNSATLFTKIEL